MRKPIIFSVEGNIGSGKSTLILQLKKFFPTINVRNENLKIKYLDEPVNIWESIKDVDGKNIIEKFYESQEKYAFSFQMMAYISRIHNLREEIKKNETDIIICERSVYTDKNVFAKMLYDEKKIEKINYDIYLKWFDEFVKDLPPIFTIYVKTDPSTSFERVKKRNRKGETIPIEYLTRCNNYHNNWITNMLDNEVLCIDGNVNYSDKAPDEWFEMIKYFICLTLNE